MKHWLIRISLAAALTLGVVPFAVPDAVAAPSFTVSPSAPMASEAFTVNGKVSTKVVRTVQLQRKSGSKWKTITTAKTASTGTFAITGAITASTSIRVVAPAAKITSTRYPAITFSARKLHVVAQKATATKPAKAVGSTAFTVATSFSPARSGRPVQLQMLASKKWHSVAAGTESTSGKASLKVKTVGGTYQYRAYAPAWHGAAAVSGSPITIKVAVGPLAITTTKLPDLTYGVPYDTKVTAADGKPPYTWTLGDEPTGPERAASLSTILPGISFDSTTGRIWGTSTLKLKDNITLPVTVTDSAGATASADLSWKLLANLDTLVITTTSLPNADYNQEYSTSLEATGGNPDYFWSADGLPDGLSMDPSGEISGQTTAAGTATVEITVDDGLTPVTKKLSLTVNGPASPLITTTSLPSGLTSHFYSATPAAIGGDGDYTWSVSGDLPDGLAFNSSTGTISGTPTASGSFPITITATDVNTKAGSQGLTLAVSRSATAVSAGFYHTCAVTDIKTVQCWGDNNAGESGRAVSTAPVLPAEVADLKFDVAEVASGQDHTCVRGTSGEVACWGEGAVGQLGNGNSGAGAASTTPVPVTTTWQSGPPGMDADGATQIVAGAHHTCLLTIAGAVWCWGYNSYGELGNGSFDNSDVPVQVTGLSSGVTAIAATEDFTCAVVDASMVKCWGANFSGQLGTGTATTTGNEGLSTPQAVTDASGDPLTGAVSVATGWAHACALNASGAFTCWGSQGGGQFGDGTSGDRYHAGDWTGSGYSSIIAGKFQTCALTTIATVACWGQGAVGQLENEDSHSLPTPSVIPALTDVTSLSAGSDHTCVVSAGATKCWGNNSWGQILGTTSSTTENQQTPVGVPGLS